MEKTEQLKNYLKNVVNPILETLVSDLLND